MIHVGALPGTPGQRHSMPEIIARAEREAVIYRQAGVDGIAIENMHDIPYLKNDVGPEIVAAMSLAGSIVKKVSGLPCGVQILAGANKAALAVALAADLDFIRVEGYVFGHFADEGLIESCAGELRRYQKQIGAGHILIVCDIKKKHSSHAITADVDIVETARAAQFFKSDGLVVTGLRTGLKANTAEISLVSEAVEIPVLVGSGVTLENVELYLEISDGLIVGSYFKIDGYWANDVDETRVRQFMEKVKIVRGNFLS